MTINQQRPLQENNGSFRTFLKNDSSGKSSSHYHPGYEMNLVIKGTGRRYVGTHEDYFEEGDLILLAPGIPHHWANNSRNKSGYSSLVMQWDENFLGKMWQATPEFQQIGKLLDLSARGIVFDREFGQEIQKNQEKLLTLPSFERLLLLLQILHDFSHADNLKVLSENDFQSPKVIPNSRIEKVLAFVEESYADKITLNMMSSLVNMSEGAFSRFFSQTFKKPFFTYLNEYRILKSHEFLKDTDMRINEIGYACGYECLQFFYRQFMKYTECAPLAYRTKFQEGMNPSP